MTLEKEISITASAENVWTILSDVERWYEWTPSIRSILLLDPKPLHLGSRALIEQPKLPRATWEVTEIDPGRGFVWQTRSIGALTVGEHWITPEADGRVRVRLRVRQTGVLAWVFQRWIESITREYLAIEANGLKRRCEQAKLDLLAQPA